jgi:hypothetical protein
MRESLSSNRDDIHRAIATLPGRYNANPKVVMGFPLKRDAYYMIERHSERQISVQFYDTTGDSIAAFVAAIKDGAVSSMMSSSSSWAGRSPRWTTCRRSQRATSSAA